jgi:Tol biopolymer transport system component
MIAFASNRAAPPLDFTLYDVYVMNADGSGVLRLTQGPANTFSADWAPPAA